MSSAIAEAVRGGDRRALARLMSLVEQGTAEGRAALRQLFPHTGRAHVVGVTGPPGSGKSTLVKALALAYRAQGKTVGIVAVDPTSPFSGGALLGDRIRMQELHADPGVFVRSMATRGSMGGLARSTIEVVHLLDAFGKEVVFVETVGVGQDEVDIARAADTTLVVGVPGLGDDVQALKAGVLEIADVFVINKADRENANQLAAELTMLLSLSEPRAWQVPIVQTVATEGRGIDQLVEAIARHRAYLEQSGHWRVRRADQARRQVVAIVEDRLKEQLERLLAQEGWVSRFDQVAERTQDPYAVAEAVVARLLARG
ncbi:MAG: methylmalonyl Co-A mutase-associated GTPase MeaB [Chloroflexi bacterium]|nr:methylmalonyl Co-A mutase-associated GTPase MeaB [Chloroflexota bacterium]